MALLIWQKIIAALNWLKASFDNHTKGASARKLTAFVVGVMVVRLHKGYISYALEKGNFEMLPEILMIDFTALLALLGLVTWESYFTNKNKKTSNEHQSER